MMESNRDYWSSENEQGNVRISEDVVASIAAFTASEIEGVNSLTVGISNEIVSRLGMKTAGKGGTKVKFDGDNVDVDIYLNVKYGSNILSTARGVQEKVKSSIESMTGLNTKSINVHITGIVLADSKDHLQEQVIKKSSDEQR